MHKTENLAKVIPDGNVKVTVGAAGATLNACKHGGRMSTPGHSKANFVDVNLPKFSSTALANWQGP